MPVYLAAKAKQASQSAPPLYTSKIINAGALLADTKTLLAHWDVANSVHENVERLRRDNVFGKVSRSRVEDILTIFRQRFLTDESVTRALVVLVRERFPATALDRILYYYATRADRLLYDVVTKVLGPLQARGIASIDVLELKRPLRQWVLEGKTSGQWSEPTIVRIAQGVKRQLFFPIALTQRFCYRSGVVASVGCYQHLEAHDAEHDQQAGESRSPRGAA
jgi:Putative inner membrane protein (DUF1819)